MSTKSVKIWYNNFNEPTDPVNISPYYYFYESFKDPSGKDDQYYTINFDREVESTSCAGGHAIANSTSHCHIFMPTDLPCDGGVYDPGDKQTDWSPDCKKLLY